MTLRKKIFASGSLPRCQLNILAYLDSCGGSALMSFSGLGEAIGFSKSGIAKALALLEKAGLVSVADRNKMPRLFRLTELAREPDAIPPSAPRPHIESPDTLAMVASRFVEANKQVSAALVTRGRALAALREALTPSTSTTPPGDQAYADCEHYTDSQSRPGPIHSPEQSE